MHKPIEMLFKSNKEGLVLPLVMKIEQEDDIVKIKLHNQIFIEENRFNGNRVYIYSCQAQDGNRLRACRLSYELDTCIWKIIELK